jgi:hypothetical protein
MIENPEEGMYIYSVERRLLQNTYYIKRSVLLSVGFYYEVGLSKQKNSKISSLEKERFNRIYFDSPKEAFKNWRKEFIKINRNELSNIEKKYEKDKENLEKEYDKVLEMQLDNLEIYGERDDYEPCDI